MKVNYHDTEELAYRLVRDFYKHNNIIIAVDFDSTLYDFKDRGYSKKVSHLIRDLSKDNTGKFTIMLYTAREGAALEFAKDHCKDLLINIDYYNESPVKMDTRKPFWNILLDDKAGLGQAYEVMLLFLKIIGYEHNP